MDFALPCLIANWNLEWKRPNSPAGRSISSLPPERRMVSHILTPPHWKVEAVAELSKHDGARKLSDHYGERFMVK